MRSHMGIRGSSSSYDMHPIEEREEEHEEFVPYAYNRQKTTLLKSFSLEFNHIKSSLSQSLDCRRKSPEKIRRCRTLHRDETTRKQKRALMGVNLTADLPQVIHSLKKHESKPQGQQGSRKDKLTQLQAEMKGHRPAFFKDKPSTIAAPEAKPSRRLNLDAVRNSLFLLELPRRRRKEREAQEAQKDAEREVRISGKELKHLMRVYKMQSSWQSDLPPVLHRQRTNP